MKKILLATAMAAIGISEGSAAVVITTTGTNVVTENFNSFVGTAGSIPTSTGFSVNDTGATAWGYQGVGTGSSATGGIFAYGTGGDNSFGFLHSSTRAGGLQFDATNSTGSTITGLTFTFSYEQWRYANTAGFSLAGVGALSSVDFSSYAFAGVTSGTNGTVGSTPITITLTGLSIANSSGFGLAWTYVDQAGSDNGIAIDNFGLSVTAVPEPSTYALIGMGLAGLVILRRMRKSAKS